MIRRFWRAVLYNLRMHSDVTSGRYELQRELEALHVYSRRVVTDLCRSLAAHEPVEGSDAYGEWTDEDHLALEAGREFLVTTEAAPR